MLSSGYHKRFPPAFMNVTIRKNESSEGKGGQARTHVLVASKSFKAGEVIYKVGSGCFEVYLADNRIRNHP